MRRRPWRSGCGCSAYPREATATAQGAPFRAARVSSPSIARPTAPRLQEPTTSRSAPCVSACRCRPRPGVTSTTLTSSASTAAAARSPSSSFSDASRSSLTAPGLTARARAQLAAVHVGEGQLAVWLGEPRGKGDGIASVGPAVYSHERVLEHHRSPCWERHHCRGAGTWWYPGRPPRGVGVPTERTPYRSARWSSRGAPLLQMAVLALGDRAPDAWCWRATARRDHQARRRPPPRLVCVYPRGSRATGRRRCTHRG